MYVTDTGTPFTLMKLGHYGIDPGIMEQQPDTNHYQMKNITHKMFLFVSLTLCPPGLELFLHESIGGQILIAEVEFDLLHDRRFCLIRKLFRSRRCRANNKEATTTPSSISSSTTRAVKGQTKQ